MVLQDARGKDLKLYLAPSGYCIILGRRDTLCIAFMCPCWVTAFTFTFSHLADAFIQSDLHM